MISATLCGNPNDIMKKKLKELGKKTKTKAANAAGMSSLGAMAIGYSSKEWLKTQKRD